MRRSNGDEHLKTPNVGLYKPSGHPALNPASRLATHKVCGVGHCAENGVDNLRLVVLFLAFPNLLRGNTALGKVNVALWVWTEGGWCMCIC